MRKRYSYYEYDTEFVTMPPIVEAHIDALQGWSYNIYNDDPDFKFWSGSNLFRQSDELYDTQAEAEFAAVGQIDKLENGEG